MFRIVRINNTLVWNHFWQDCGKLHLMLWSNYGATLPAGHMFRDSSLFVFVWFTCIKDTTLKKNKKTLLLRYKYKEHKHKFCSTLSFSFIISVLGFAWRFWLMTLSSVWVYNSAFIVSPHWNCMHFPTRQKALYPFLISASRQIILFVL